VLQDGCETTEREERTVPSELILEVADYQGPTQWYWRLTEAGGRFLGDHEAKLNPRDAEYAGFLDLYGYLKQNASPFNRRAEEARLVEEVGAWIGREVLGPLGEVILQAGTPSVVRVVIPPEPEAAGLLYRPLELAHAQGKPLAVQDVSLVFEITGDQAPVVMREVGQKLRMLAVFSVPTTATALNLRQERHQLKRMIESLAAQRNLALELRVLQYGVTREALKKIFQEGEGWDIVHFSGHGQRGRLLLEKPDGTADEVTSEEWVELLRPARGSVKWVTLSACLSAEATIEETLRWLGLEPKRKGASAPPPDEADDPTRHLPAVARALVRDLDCAVLSMRYPVGDQFAIDLGRALYGNVLKRHQPLPRAVQTALPDAAKGAAASPLSVAIPALFGRRATALRVVAPVNPSPSFAIAPTGLAHFPPPPEVFIGRVAVLSKASGALAPESGKSGILFHGMAGGGKTACALELAHLYRDLERFTAFAWYRAPEEGKDIGGALVNLALALERQLPTSR
jgi:hypothetical protein